MIGLKEPEICAGLKKGFGLNRTMIGLKDSKLTALTELTLV